MDSFDLGVLNPGNVYLAYLPLAHIMELISEIHLIASRVLIIYGNPHTLSDAGVKLKRPESSGDMALARPHMLVFAPAVLEKMHTGLLLKFKGLKKFLLNKALRNGEKIYAKCDGTKATVHCGSSGRIIRPRAGVSMTLPPVP